MRGVSIPLLTLLQQSLGAAADPPLIQQLIHRVEELSHEQTELSSVESPGPVPELPERGRPLLRTLLLVNGEGSELMLLSASLSSFFLMHAKCVSLRAPDLRAPCIQTLPHLHGSPRQPLAPAEMRPLQTTAKDLLSSVVEDMLKLRSGGRASARLEAFDRHLHSLTRPPRMPLSSDWSIYMEQDFGSSGSRTEICAGYTAVTRAGIWGELSIFRIAAEDDLLSHEEDAEVLKEAHTSPSKAPINLQQSGTSSLKHSGSCCCESAASHFGSAAGN
ncbi:hypothetical protein DNTS_022802 [Danionella cerebrum]|uniref:Uncharacterized protein n=1 Tax=Danionella cerebrum TaxID=2873325 RepID=A0A553MTN3_9TELE|nr:hypothetical protein DNTS_022802 [Danionella translucida]